jgi:hypothetical protein
MKTMTVDQVLEAERVAENLLDRMEKEPSLRTLDPALRRKSTMCE